MSIFLGKNVPKIYDKEIFLAYVGQKEKCVEIEGVDFIGKKEKIESKSDFSEYSKNEAQLERVICCRENSREIAGFDRATWELQ